MMNLLEMLMDQQNTPALQQLSKGFGLSEGDTRNVLSEMVPALTRGMQTNLSQAGGLESLLGALSRGNHQRYVDQPENLAGVQATDEGNAILGHLLGSKDVSRRVAQHAAGKTGVDEGMLKKMLPVIASMVMGSVSKQASAQNMLGGQSAGSPTAGSLLGQFLDADKDGSVIDDVIGLAGRFMR